MKRVLLSMQPRRRGGRKLLCLLLTGSLLAWHHLAYAGATARQQDPENPRVSLHMTRASMAEVISQIEKQTHLSFAYDVSMLPPREINLNIDAQPLKEVLTKLFPADRFEYTVKGDQVIISVRNTKTTTSNGNSSSNTAQEKFVITGNVTDGTNGLPGVTVLEKGTHNGTSTDENGRFRLAVSDKNAVLLISFIGYEPREVAIKGSATVHVQLQTDQKKLDEVVVTALGIKKEKKALGYAVQEVKGETAVKAREPNAVNSLAGKVSGLVITTPTRLFQNPGIYLRGVKPLIVVDGVPINSDSWNLSADDIESYSVLKGPNAAALYGSQGQNGAILITTKKGTTDKRGISVELNSSTQFQMGFLAIPTKQEEYGPGSNFQYEYVDGMGGGTNDADYDIWGPKFEGQPIPQYNSPIDPQTGKLVPIPWQRRGHDNLRNFLRKGLLSSNNIAISANNDKGNMRMSVTQLYQKGAVPNTKLGGTNVNFSGTLNVSKKMTLSTAINYDKQYTPNYPDATYQPSSPIYTLMLWSGADYDIRDLKNYWMPGKEGIQQRNFESYQYTNPYLTAYEALHGYYKNDLYGHIKLNYTFNDHWSGYFRTNVSSYDLSENKRYPISGSYRSGDGGYFIKGGYNESGETYWDNNTDMLLSYNNKIGKSFDVKASAGGNLRTVKYSRLYAHTNNGLLLPQLWTVDNSVDPPGATSVKNSRQVKSAYASVDFSFRDYLFLGMTGRMDQSSTLPANKNAYFYPSVSLSAVMSDILHLPKAISFWKLRASYANVGGDMVNDDGTAKYNLYPSYSVGSRWDGNPAEVFGDILYNPNIKPAFSKSYEVGTDIRLLNNRLGFDVSVYKTLDGPQIFYPAISEGSGFKTRQMNGLVTMRKGIEISLNASPIRSANGFNWDVLVNWSTYQKYLNKVYDTLNVYNRVKIGERMDQIFMTDLQRTPDGKLVLGSNGQPRSNSYVSMVGYANDKWVASIINTFSYKNLSLRIQVDGRYGGKIINYLDQKMWQGGNHPLSANQYRQADWENRNTAGYKGTFVPDGMQVTGGSLQVDGDGNVISDTRKFAPNTTPVLWQTWSKNYYGNAITNLYDRSYLKIREVVLTYNVPSPLLKRAKIINRASISVVGRNLYYLAHKGVRDIDVDQWIDQNAGLEMPSTRSVGFNINLVF
ncbi:SusC/RagA family TonB-linked outer membrane protein [Chitinophaga varians]|uniref:SusC/RagA family TonB-linked outer membrane protein n=1 Tax=Chitinophaga varians TaxID=2202339 RepID=UPI00165EE6AD|nr:SusC/RagA family TonB-linked outer membrane protein [Chitinophaga varians]MBC9914178.1 SusC/RagA family TonB-linked outer membrane protein [Chitinophaga varians]